ncbi:MAG: DUF4384 domain-containing protein [Deltaproteobacteria bacterium]|nr:DUF4384 domain-containing protein [Deltaproteobacteria bacterium]
MSEPERLLGTRRHPGCPTEIALALSLTDGGLAASERRAVREHAEGCAHCSQRLFDLERERQQLHHELPVLELETGRQPSMLRWWPALAAACACMLLLAGVWMLWPAGPAEPATGSVRFKGCTPRASFRVERQGRVFAGRSGMRLLAGDRICFAYSISEDAYLLVVNVDGQGRPSIYYPAGAACSAAIRAGEEVFLPISTRLDDYLGPERIFALFSRRLLTCAAVEAAVRRAWAGSVEDLETLPLDAFQQSFLIIKVAAE